MSNEIIQTKFKRMNTFGAQCMCRYGKYMSATKSGHCRNFAIYGEPECKCYNVKHIPMDCPNPQYNGTDMICESCYDKLRNGDGYEGMYISLITHLNTLNRIIAQTYYNVHNYVEKLIY